MQFIDDAAVPDRGGDERGGGRGAGLQCRYWIGTSFAPDPPAFGEAAGALRYWIYQREATADGRRHWQWYCEFKRAVRLAQVRRTVGGNPHCEPRAGTREQARDYCRKPCDRDKSLPACGCEPRCPRDAPPYHEGGQWELEPGRRNDWEALKEAVRGGASYWELAQGDFTALCAKHSRFVQDYIEQWRQQQEEKLQAPDFYPWQTQVLQEIQEQPHPRRITWCWEPVGGAGKSVFATFLSDHHNALVLEGGKKADIAYIIAKTQPLPKIIIFDIPRSTVDTADHLYSCMEAIKNRRLTSTKYESRVIRLPPTHLLVFSNFPPDPSKLSRDRLEASTWTIQNSQLSPHFSPNLVRADFAGVRPQPDCIDLSGLNE